MSTRAIAKITALALCAALLVPAASLAQSSSDRAYGGNNAKVLGLTEGNGSNGDNAPSVEAKDSGPVKTTRATGSSLPFTGADLGVLAVAGAALIGLGFGLRRLTHSPTQA